MNSIDYFRRYTAAVETVIRDVPEHDHVFIQEGRNSTVYHFNGLSGLRAIIVALVQNDCDPPQAIMDFGCAYGRVLRYMRAAFPESEITACDVRADAIAYCASTFGATPLMSSPDFADLEFPRKHDIIWMGSVVTHFSEAKSKVLIERMIENLNPGGILVFSVHGRIYPLEVQPDRWKILDSQSFDIALDEYARTGFGYHDYPDRPGIGASLTSPAWLFGMVYANKDLTFSYQERGWTGWHDVAVIKKGFRSPYDRHKDRPY